MKENRPIIKGLVMITQIGISMIAPIFLGALIGYWLDRLFGTGFLFLVFLVLGILAAFRNIYKLTKPFYAEDLKREQKEQAYWDSLKKERLQNRRAGEASAEQEHAAAQSGAVLRRERMQLYGERLKEDADASIGRRETAEEAFAAWRRERERGHDGSVGNGRESCRDGQDGGGHTGA